MKVRIGIGSLPVGGSTGADGFVELVDELEARGIDSLWLPDLVGTDAVDAHTGMAFALGRTRTLKVGTGVLVLPGRNPALVAAELASLATLAPKRVLPAFGVRPARARERQLYPVPGDRAAVFEEALVVVRRLLTEDRVTHHGEFFQLTDARVGPRPPGHVDLWLGGRARVGLERIGRLADGWLGSFVTPAEAAECRAIIERAAAAAGRAVEPDHYGTNLAVVPPEATDAQIAAALANSVDRRPDVSPDQIVAHGWAQARERIAEYVDAGLTKFVVRPATPVPDWRGFLDRFDQELRPLESG
ncbi:TIGR03854 family LLM class F420-dependent oxidoreductase [Pseudonocardia sp. WMMC193]|uniref:TIGR03854 family LLM class F420-dependent oxidoreductase n=1 Tax=Pseudonocardia sp. WMMC193 TaxID=2911965 RepID=UPI001F01638F|nr:TIGR03854 family LLM class F420-dependent oxidoreductase [Pseudonocardia sp. WMMC193]MCF7549684.1 TIGR03854 family LLM class F420-dependent oxidoreductase [Pseudonocardia sp. WMMC193]